MFFFCYYQHMTMSWGKVFEITLLFCLLLTEKLASLVLQKKNINLHGLSLYILSNYPADIQETFNT